MELENNDEFKLPMDSEVESSIHDSEEKTQVIRIELKNKYNKVKIDSSKISLNPEAKKLIIRVYGYCNTIRAEFPVSKEKRQLVKIEFDILCLYTDKVEVMTIPNGTISDPNIGEINGYVMLNSIKNGDL
jgi:hypothetical protein